MPSNTQNQSMIPGSMADNPVSKALAAFDSSKYNLITPIVAIDKLPPMYRVSVSIVKVDSEKETYAIPGSSKRGLGKTALDKIAGAACVKWLPELCGQIDTWNDPYRVKYRAVGVYRDTNGQIRSITGEKAIDLRGRRAGPDVEMGADTLEIIRQADASKDKPDPWKRIMAKRVHIHSLAESESKNRALRNGLAIPIAMEPEDIAKPFVVPALVPDLDPNDPQTKKMMLDNIFDSQSLLYGPERTGPAPIIDITPEPSENTETAAPPKPLPHIEEPEPWDDAGAELGKPAISPLPVTKEQIDTIKDPRRSKFIDRINELTAHLRILVGPERGQQLLIENFSDFKPLVCTTEEFAKAGLRLKQLIEQAESK